MYKHFFKRIIDIILALIGLPFLIILFLPISIAILINDFGPIFYCGKRIGKNGKIFRMIKFRSMKVNAPDLRLENGSTYNGDDDPRVTKVGKFLRKTSLDELPQILNVLFGQMSFIGPRPDPLDWLERYSEEDKIVLKVKPGITGYSQAYFRNQADGPEKIKNDKYYVNNISFWLDIKIFFKTFITVIKKDKLYKEDKNVVEIVEEDKKN